MSISDVYKSYMSNVLMCKYPLPDPEFQDYVFQTKAFDGLLDRYSITRDGRLILHAIAQEFVPPEERPNYGTPEWNSPWGPWEGAFRPVPVGDEEIPFHGYFEFYTVITNHGAPHSVEYRAKFDRGRLQEIVRAEPPSAE